MMEMWFLAMAVALYVRLSVAVATKKSGPPVYGTAVTGLWIRGTEKNVMTAIAVCLTDVMVVNLIAGRRSIVVLVV